MGSYLNTKDLSHTIGDQGKIFNNKGIIVNIEYSRFERAGAYYVE